MRKIFLLLFTMIFFDSCVFADELTLQTGKVYLLNIDEEIQNMHTDEKIVDAQILHSIFNDKRQIILSLKDGENGILQIKTKNGLENYNLKNSPESSKKLIEIDIPPFENLDVDIYTEE